MVLGLQGFFLTVFLATAEPSALAMPTSAGPPDWLQAYKQRSSHALVLGRIEQMSQATKEVADTGDFLVVHVVDIWWITKGSRRLSSIRRGEVYTLPVRNSDAVSKIEQGSVDETRWFVLSSTLLGKLSIVDSASAAGICLEPSAPPLRLLQYDEPGVEAPVRVCVRRVTETTLRTGLFQSHSAETVVVDVLGLSPARGTDTRQRRRIVSVPSLGREVRPALGYFRAGEIYWVVTNGVTRAGRGIVIDAEHAGICHGCAEHDLDERYLGPNELRKYYEHEDHALVRITVRAIEDAMAMSSPPIPTRVHVVTCRIDDIVWKVPGWSKGLDEVEKGNVLELMSFPAEVGGLPSAGDAVLYVGETYSVVVRGVSGKVRPQIVAQQE